MVYASKYLVYLVLVNPSIISQMVVVQLTADSNSGLTLMLYVRDAPQAVMYAPAPLLALHAQMGLFLMYLQKAAYALLDTLFKNYALPAHPHAVPLVCHRFLETL